MCPVLLFALQAVLMDALIEVSIAWKVAQEKQNIDTKDEVFKSLGICGQD